MFDLKKKKKNKYTHGYVRSSTLSCVVFTPGDIAFQFSIFLSKVVIFQFVTISLLEL